MTLPLFTRFVVFRTVILFAPSVYLQDISTPSFVTEINDQSFFHDAFWSSPFLIFFLFQERKDREEDVDISESLLAGRESFDHTFPVAGPKLSSRSKSRPSQGRLYRKAACLTLLRRIGVLSLYILTAGLAFNGLYHLLKPFGGHIRVALGMPVDYMSSCSCGSSPIEAMARSCRYDTIAAAWLPPHCRDEELTAQFDATGPGAGGAWTYYADEFGHISISTDEIALLPANDSQDYFFTTHRWHVLHCSYYWRKMYRMVHGIKGAAKQIEHRFDTDGHIAHCEMMFLKETSWTELRLGAGSV
ncbi:hypothetical protein LARI1_G003637 [Lachnellula arida]|uniref:Uncharacterized protein n=1 Tax=Lachnellula arida TaxID=1316785 RepID=A0A8T9BG05_9HELO|nr:hypothetical protein LARI1_G003637 [Lachnellula arida]